MSVTAVQGDWSDFHQRALERVSALPGVQQAAFAWGVPLTGNSWPGNVEIEGAARGEQGERPDLGAAARSDHGLFQTVGADDFRWARHPFHRCPRRRPAVAVINQALADRYFPKANPIGKKLWLCGQKAADRNRRRGNEWPHRRPDAGGRARNLSFAVAGLCVFQAPGDSNRGGPALADARGRARRCVPWIQPWRSKTSRLWNRFAVIRWRRVHSRCAC